jgi:hypothetical protein
VPCCGRHRISRLSQSQTHRGDPKFLLAPQLDDSRHNVALRSSGIERGKYWLPLVTDIPFGVKTKVDIDGSSNKILQCLCFMATIWAWFAERLFWLMISVVEKEVLLEHSKPAVFLCSI